jgi:hypothetical protein
MGRDGRHQIVDRPDQRLWIAFWSPAEAGPTLIEYCPRPHSTWPHLTPPDREPHQCLYVITGLPTARPNALMISGDIGQVIVPLPAA